MSFKKLLCVLCCIAICFTLVACDRTPPNTPSSDSNGNPGGEITDDNDVETLTPDQTEHNFALKSSTGGAFVYQCSDCNQQATVVLTCLSGTDNAYTVEGNTITFHGITKQSEYDIHGAFYGDIVIDVGDSYKFELQLSGLELYCYKSNPITVLSGDKITISAKKSTQNNIYDMRDAVNSSDDDAVSASVYALRDLDIQGKGSLSVMSVNNNGIHTKKELTVQNLSLQVDCQNNALKGNDGVTIKSGDVVLIARQGDGIKTTNSDISNKGNQRGAVAINGGNVLIYSACDGIDSAYDVVIDESLATVNLQIFTDRYSKYSQEVTSVADDVYYVRFNSTAYKYSIKFYNDSTDVVWSNSSSSKTVGNNRYYPITKPSGYAYMQLFVYDSSQQQGQDRDYIACTEGMAVNNNYDTIAVQSKGNSITYSWTNYTTNQGGGFGPGGMGGPNGMNDGNKDKGDYSTKGIKSDNCIAISAGTVTVSSYDDALHANNDVALENGATPLGNITISGGSVTLRSNDDAIHAEGKVAICGGSTSIVSSYEGVEGNTVEVSGGNVSIVATDDGINGTARSGTGITISGGSLYIYAGGDGVDSNSTTSYEGIHFAGGRSVIISTGQADSSIDTERGYKYSGGYVIGIGKSGGMGSESTNCANFSSVATSKTLSLQKDAYLVIDGVATVKMPVAINALVVCLGQTGANIKSNSSTGYGLDVNGVYWNV